MAQQQQQPKIAGTIRSKNPLKGGVEILPERLYYATMKAPPPSHNILASIPKRDGVHYPSSSTTDKNKLQQAQADGTGPPNHKKKQIHFFNIDNELVYWNFFLDFGPLNLGQVTRFCEKLNDKLEKFPVVCFYSSTVSAKRANAIWLICVYQLLYLNRTPEEAWNGFKGCFTTTNNSHYHFETSSSSSSSGLDGAYMSMPPVSHSQGSVTVAPLPPWHDASPCMCTYDLTILDCLQGFQKARMHGFFDVRTFDVDEYEHFEQVENGDLNWIVKDKILAFAGPSFERNVSPEGFCTLSPNDYIPYFQRKNVGLVVRLNKRSYNEQDFVQAGIQHMDAFFLDGSCPPTKVLYKVLDAFEQQLLEYNPSTSSSSASSSSATTAIAVHCKAGLGRTGSCIGAYLMKHYRFTASEAIAWMRICRPGCVIGPQQHFLKQIEARMWAEGEAHRGRRVERCLVSRTAVAAATEIMEEDGDEIVMDAATINEDEAIAGRVGQAEALLASRGGKAHRNSQRSSLENHIITPAPRTPEQSNKSSVVAVTPDTSTRNSQTAQLWCG